MFSARGRSLASSITFALGWRRDAGTARCLRWTQTQAPPRGDRARSGHARARLRAMRAGHARGVVQFLLRLHAAAAERRRALHAVYAFCRFIDDIADEAGVRDPAVLLARWREELERVFGGAPTRPVSRALADSVRRFNIPRRYFDEVIDGVEMDLSRTRYQTFDDLRLYCYRVASAVGLMCIEIFGYRNPRHAHLRRQPRHRLPVDQHPARCAARTRAAGRIYLPLDDLARFGVEPGGDLRRRLQPALSSD